MIVEIYGLTPTAACCVLRAHDVMPCGQDLGAPEEWRLKGVSQPYAPQIEALKQLPRLSSPYLKARVRIDVISPTSRHVQRG